MVSTVENLKALERKSTSPVPRAKRYAGEVVYIYAFDVAYEMSRKPVRELLGQPVAQFVVDASKRSPRHLFFYRPQMVRLPPLERIGPGGPLRVERAIKLLPVGAISITVRVPFEVQRIEDLVALSRSAVQQRFVARRSPPARRGSPARACALLYPTGSATRGRRSLHGFLPRIAARCRGRNGERLMPRTGGERTAAPLLSLLTQEPDIGSPVQAGSR